jgi:hypothetical protein
VTYGSLFSGIGGIGLSPTRDKRRESVAKNVVAISKLDKACSVKGKRDGFQFPVKFGVTVLGRDEQVAGGVVFFIAVNVMYALPKGKWSPSGFRGHFDMFGDVAASPCVRVRGIKDVSVFTPTDDATLPVGVESAVLISFI